MRHGTDRREGELSLARQAMAGARLPEAIRRLAEHDATMAPPLCDSPVFLLSAGWRSGSTLMQRVIASDGGILVWGEPWGDHVPVHRLAQMLEPFADQDHHARYAIDRFEGELTESWTANLNPGPAALRAAHRAWFEAAFAEPARQRGFTRWGCKWVRLDGGHAWYLRWLYPNCRIVFQVRHPLDAWQSYRAKGARWYLARPHLRVRTSAAFLAHWAHLASSFLDERDPLGAHLLRYEDLVAGEDAVHALAGHLGLQLDAGVLDARVGASRRTPRADVPARVLCATRYRSLLARLDYSP